MHEESSETFMTTQSAPKTDVGLIVFVIAKTNSDYTPSDIVELSAAIDPMIDEFDGYLGRKMLLDPNEASLVSDLVYYRDMEAFASASEREMASETCLKFFATMLPGTETMLISTPKIIQGDAAKAAAVDVAWFELTDTNDADAFVAQAKLDNPLTAGAPGCLGFRLSVTEQGQWFAASYWASVEDAPGGGYRSEAISRESLSTLLLPVAIDTEHPHPQLG
jgi:hypothetical protein